MVQDISLVLSLRGQRYAVQKYFAVAMGLLDTTRGPILRGAVQTIHIVSCACNLSFCIFALM